MDKKTYEALKIILACVKGEVILEKPIKKVQTWVDEVAKDYE